MLRLMLSVEMPWLVLLEVHADDYAEKDRDDGHAREYSDVGPRAASTSTSPPMGRTMSDPDHSEGEQRFLVLGMSARSRLVAVAYAERPPRTRIINARRASRPERPLRAFARLARVPVRTKSRQKRTA